MLDKLFMAMIMLAMNLGGRFIVMDLPESIDQLFTQSSLLRMFVIFALFFSATQHIWLSIIFTLLFVIVMKYLLNCDSEFCLLNKEEFQSKRDHVAGKSKKVSEEEYIQAKRVVESFISQKYSGLSS
jgi:hypothetical protein